ncbi:DNA-binding domain-containing protein, AraC-type [Aequorivita sublithincola DSM 14238]|uniref:DNA-binding domain-containing protein, AraC-type n=1 Tax=Aequorivita sublithincola (strain DSM 14238 / LMG 21431 / ACAM 643 / 9-3) TaxID=746697 RepID=I3YTY6_AEQSU|nr:helix-turn-helix domain-containing protein [Aequorivita sublithincola]AFL80454.1 DNA-binding domain-containing protein, AraC-type [Aequorivita sublithincola DSM 14238]
MKIDIYYSLVIAAIFQGFWLSYFILLTKKFNSNAARFLGLLILVVTISQLQYNLGETGIISWKQFNIIYLPIEFLEAPFLYFFATFYLQPDRKIVTGEKALFIPFVFFIGNTLLYKSIAFTTNKNWDEHPLLLSLVEINVLYGDFVNILSLFIVLLIVLFKIVRTEIQSRTYYSENIPSEFLWLKILLVAILFLLLFWGYHAIQFYFDQSVSYLPVDVAVSILIYVLGYIGIQKLNIIKERENIRTFNRSHEQLYSVVEDSKNENISKIEEIVINKQRYLDSNFSSETLAEELQLSTSHLSRIFNNEMNVSFTDYINTLRVEEAKKYLRTPEFSGYTLVAIGLEAGFNSKTTFNTTFKKITGQTPSQFKKSSSN